METTEKTQVWLVSGPQYHPFVQVVTFEGEMLWGGSLYTECAKWARQHPEYELVRPAKPVEEKADPRSSEPKTSGTMCTTCEQKPQYCKGECSRCYGHRRRFGKAWPNKE